MERNIEIYSERRIFLPHPVLKDIYAPKTSEDFRLDWIFLRMYMMNFYLNIVFHFKGVWSTPPANENKLNRAFRVNNQDIDSIKLLVECIFHLF